MRALVSLLKVRKMALATITSKGQTTIPKSIREHLRLKAGDRIEFIIDKEGRVELYPKRDRYR